MLEVLIYTDEWCPPEISVIEHVANSHIPNKAPGRELTTLGSTWL